MMIFPWNKYEELPVSRRPTLQIFITNRCDLSCKGCFARHVMKDDVDISRVEYVQAVDTFWGRGGQQINLLGGEPLLHPDLEWMLDHNQERGLKTTVYTNGRKLNEFSDIFTKYGAKLRVSLYGTGHPGKGVSNLFQLEIPFDANYMVSRTTTVDDMLSVASFVEHYCWCKVFFISSLRELDNPRQEFFDDTDLTMPVIEYKELVHRFLWEYDGNMDIHVSKRGVFESTTTKPDCHCNFANYIIGGRIIQCPYDLVNEVYCSDYTLGKRFCEHNTTCLMSKVIYRKR